MAKMLLLTQSDGRWSLNKIGNTALTLGRWGCTITCLSMFSSFYGCYKSPAEIAKMPGLFDAQGRIYWGAIEKAFGGKIKFVYRYGGQGKAVFNRKAILASLENSPNTTVMLEVRNFSHWVAVVGVYGDDFYVIDPIDGKKKLAIKSFGNITGSAHLIKA